jgi:acyl dehydratase
LEIVYYEDLEPRKKLKVGDYHVDKEEMIEFAKKWDAKPFHIDEDLAKSYPSGGLIAPLTYIMSIMSRLGSISERPVLAYLAALEIERLQIVTPVRPGDQLFITEEYIDKRQSRNRSDCGIIRILYEVKNQNDDLCISSVFLSLVAKRPT